VQKEMPAPNLLFPANHTIANEWVQKCFNIVKIKIQSNKYRDIRMVKLNQLSLKLLVSVFLAFLLCSLINNAWSQQKSTIVKK